MSRVRRQVAQVVCPQREHKRAARTNVCGQRGEVPLTLTMSRTDGDRLLSLVDHQGLPAPPLQPGARPARRPGH